MYDVLYAELWECDTTIWQPMVAGRDAELTCSKACQSALSKVRAFFVQSRCAVFACRLGTCLGTACF